MFEITFGLNGIMFVGDGYLLAELILRWLLMFGTAYLLSNIVDAMWWNFRFAQVDVLYHGIFCSAAIIGVFTGGAQRNPWFNLMFAIAVLLGWMISLRQRRSL